MTQKIFSSALCRKKDGAEAVQAITSKVALDLKGHSCDLALFFVSLGYDQDLRHLSQLFRERVSPKFLIGCNASGVIGDTNEIEMGPAASVLAMHLPNAEVSSFSISESQLNTFQSGSDLVEYLDLYPTERPKFILLGDPMSLNVNKLLDLFNQGYQDAPVIGGLASGMVSGSANRLVLNDEIYSNGAVGLALTRDIEFEVIVSQGCRPIGEPFAITKAEQNILYELRGKPAFHVLTAVLEKLSPEDQRLAQHSLFAGLVMDELRTDFKRGDFLIRNILGIDPTTGALAVGAMLETGQTVQFQLRDASASEEDLKSFLTTGGRKPEHEGRSAGGVLVSCCGRGKGLFGVADHDVRMIQSLRGPVPLTGFFANGEFGPVDRKNYIHGYTSSLTLIR